MLVLCLLRGWNWLKRLLEIPLVWIFAIYSCREMSSKFVRICHLIVWIGRLTEIPCFISVLVARLALGQIRFRCPARA